MELFWELVRAFLCGGALCLIGQLLIDKTALTPAKILVTYVVSGVVLGGLGLYEHLVDLAGAGATIPLTGYGYLLAKGVRTAVEERGQLSAYLLARPDLYGDKTELPPILLENGAPLTRSP